MTGLFKSLLTYRGVVAVALMFWCAGAGCMMVSYARGVSETDLSVRVDEQPMNGMHASMDAHACCKAKYQSARHPKAAKPALDLQFTQFGLPTPIRDVMSCCPLTTGSIVIASRSQSDDNGSAVLQPTASALGSENSYQKPLAIPLRLPSRAHSYLLDCAFLS